MTEAIINFGRSIALLALAVCTIATMNCAPNNEAEIIGILDGVDTSVLYDKASSAERKEQLLSQLDRIGRFRLDEIIRAGNTYRERANSDAKCDEHLLDLLNKLIFAVPDVRSWAEGSMWPLSLDSSGKLGLVDVYPFFGTGPAYPFEEVARSYDRRFGRRR